MDKLTPYDTGARLEPHVWPASRLAEDDDFYGRVDFDNEESATVMTIFVERTADGYRVCINTDDNETTEVVFL